MAQPCIEQVLPERGLLMKQIELQIFQRGLQTVTQELRIFFFLVGGGDCFLTSVVMDSLDWSSGESCRSKFT